MHFSLFSFFFLSKQIKIKDGKQLGKRRKKDQKYYDLSWTGLEPIVVAIEVSLCYELMTHDKKSSSNGILSPFFDEPNLFLDA